MEIRTPNLFIQRLNNIQCLKVHASADHFNTPTVFTEAPKSKTMAKHLKNILQSLVAMA